MKRLVPILTTVLLGIAPREASAQVPPGVPSPAPPKPVAVAGRFSEEEIALFRATTDPFQLNGIPVNPGNDRSRALAPFIDHTIPAYQEMARATRDYLALDRIAGSEPGRVDSEMKTLSNQWEGFITGSVFDDPAGGPDIVRHRRLGILRADLRRIVRARATGLGARNESVLPAMSGAMELSLKEIGGFIHLQVRNRTARAWHHVVLTARRVQDPGSLPSAGEDDGVFSGLISLLGLGEEAIPAGDGQLVLLENFQTAEHGAFVYAPEVGPGATVGFFVAPVENLEYTKVIEVSMWSDEGQELRIRADPAALRGPAPQAPPANDPRRSQLTGTVPEKKPPLGSSSRLHGAKGLDGSKGLNGAALDGSRGLEGAK
jgi:hypothetical protein